MPYVFNVAYLIALLLLSPWLLYKALTTGKYRRGLASKFLGDCPHRFGTAPCAWFHGVSVGEIHLLRPLVARFRRRHPDWHCVISTTTDTGHDEARKRFPDLPVFFWPLDFTWAVHRALRQINPSLVILAEGELWPNFLWAAHLRGVPVVVVNGRMSPKSYRRWHRFAVPIVRWFVQKILNTITLWGVQTEEYAACYRSLGVLPERVHVTGSVKYDGVESDRLNPRTQELRRLFAVDPADLVWVAGSTQAPEEKLVLDIYRRLKDAFPRLRLALVPRQKDRFDEVASLLEQSHLPFVRRSALAAPVADRAAVILVDSMGELSAVWGLAQVAYVGGSLDGRRGGQNMIEPAAYGAAALFGPHVWNFRDTAARLVGAGAAVQVADAAALETAVRHLFADPDDRDCLGQAARRLVLAQLGAAERTLDLIDTLIHGQQAPLSRTAAAA
jgi:3-deoxy-D-manno-octulosonic-acid transferase